MKITLAGLAVIRATVVELKTGVIAVTGLIAKIFDDGVGRSLLNDTGRIATGTAQCCLFAAARSKHRMHPSSRNNQNEEE